MDNSIKEKIGKLMEMARRGGTEAEMTVAMQKVQELLLKHNICMSDVENREIKDEDVIEERHDCKQGQSWIGDIYYGLSELYFCQYYQTTYNFLGKRRLSYCVVGKESNTQTVRLIAGYLINLAEELAKKPGSDLIYRNSFKRGFGDRVLARCSAERKKAILQIDNQNKETGLVVIDPYALTLKENEAYLKSKGIKLRMTNAYRAASNSDAYSAGSAAGDRVNLKSSATGRLN